MSLPHVLRSSGSMGCHWYSGGGFSFYLTSIKWWRNFNVFHLGIIIIIWISNYKQQHTNPRDERRASSSLKRHSVVLVRIVLFQIVCLFVLNKFSGITSCSDAQCKSSDNQRELHWYSMELTNGCSAKKFESTYEHRRSKKKKELLSLGL